MQSEKENKGCPAPVWKDVDRKQFGVGALAFQYLEAANSHGRLAG